MSRTSTRIGLSVHLLLLCGLIVSYGPSAHAGACVEHLDCDDTMFCNGEEQCVNLVCEPGTPKDCSDGIACSTDSCDEGLGQCVSTAAPNCPDCSGDSVPDLCIGPNSNDANWSDDIWDLPLQEYPDNIKHFPGLFVRLPNARSIRLDTHVVIEGLDVKAGGTLRANQGGGADLTITTTPPSGIINKGDILVANDTNIVVRGGTFALSDNGQYLAQPGIGQGTTASLTAKDISLTFGGCGTTTRLIITDGMTATTTTGDLKIDGTGVNTCGSAGSGTASRGGKTPPILSVGSPTAVWAGGRAAPGGVVVPVQLNIFGSFQMLEGAEVCVGCNRGANSVPGSIVVGGDFDNQSVLPSFFRWPRGNLNLPAGVHAFEVAGLDLGPFNEGFNTDADAASDTNRHTNFSMAHITVTDKSVVTFQDTFANTGGTEALYVNTLTLESGSSIIVNGCAVYYCELEDNGALISFLNEGTLEQVDCGIPAVSTWGLLAMTGLLLCVGTVLVTRRSQRSEG